MNSSQTRIFAGAGAAPARDGVLMRGGLFRCGAGESRWEGLSEGLPENAEIHAILVHPHDPEVIFVGTQDGPYRSTDGTVFSVIEGRGRAVIGGATFEFTARDTFVVPSWQTVALYGSEETVLFSYSDKPVQRALGLWREEQLQ